MSQLFTRFAGATGRILYGLYAWILLAVIVLFAVLAATFVPGLHRRRRWLAAAARTFFALAGIPTSLSGLEKLPQDHCVVVANHAGYIDGLILQAYLPPRFSFVIKGEARSWPVAHFALRRIGAKFVERFIATGSTRDARALLKAASAGESLAVFPEGTFIAKPGLGRFRLGAFAAAIKGGIPVVPLSIRGARRILPAKSFLLSPGPLQIDILDPIDVTGVSSAELAELARQSILGVLDEPDLLSNAAE
jgi:1-acyl-sn-glycerol-3-phosphate acyltransferase